jgi:hypothetical protein
MNDNNLNAKMWHRFSSLYDEILGYVRKCGAETYAWINPKLLGKAVIDYYEDIEKLKVFEGMKKINEAKIYAYETYWLLRRKPIQIINQNTPEGSLYLNEFIFAVMMVTKLYKEAGLSIQKANSHRMDYISLMTYNFKYREYNQKSLELAAEGFLLGCKQNEA